VRALTRLKLRPPVGAALVLLALVGTVTLAVYTLSGPMRSWAAKAPETVEVARVKLRDLLRPLERVTETAQEVERATAATGGEETPQVVVRGPSLISRVFGTTQRFVAAMLQVIILLYFLLAAGDLFLQKLVKVLPHLDDKRTAIHVARKIEASISTYLLTATAANTGEGIVVAIAMWLLGMPNPVLWGVVAAVLDFIPYLGAITNTVILLLAALVTFDSVGRALAVPAAFVAINLVYSNVVIPYLMGTRLTLNPVAIFVGLAFWWWIWGIPGAFIAVPLMAVLKIVSDHITPLVPIGEFLSRRDEEERRATVRLD
jgi:predicted PurR-regulated permease PerM